MPVELDHLFGKRVDELLVRIHVAGSQDRPATSDERAAQAQKILELLRSAVAIEHELLRAPADWRPMSTQVSRAIGMLSVRLRQLTLPTDE